MSATRGDFRGDDYEFAMGQIKGLRSWRVDAAGRLTGVSYHEVWKPGENVARCWANSRPTPCPVNVLEDHDRQMRRAVYSAGEINEDAVREAVACAVEGCDGKVHVRPRHDFDASCECGYWAYDEEFFESHGDVVGVIGGFGRTTIGTRGFRSEKARVLALCREDEDGETVNLSTWLRLQQLYPEAQFFDDFDAMVLKHGEVLHTWAPVTEDFWDDDYEGPADTWGSYTAYLNKLAASLGQSGAFFPPPSFKIGGTP